MSTIVTPRTILEELSVGIEPLKLKPWNTKSQGALLITTVVLLVLSAVISIVPLDAFPFPSTLALKKIGLVFLFLSIITCIAYQVSWLFPLLLQLRNTEKSMLSPVIDQFDKDLELIQKLQIFNLYHLEHATARIELVAKQLRSQVAIVVGALEKVGILPLIITGYFTFEKLTTNEEAVFSGWEAASIALILIYILSVHFLLVSQHLDRMHLTLKRAVSLKLRDKMEQPPI